MKLRGEIVDLADVIGEGVQMGRNKTDEGGSSKLVNDRAESEKLGSR
jgi:hypothetical protein